jgi:threonine/homoserine/homoserine lactone efflux protein
MGDAIGQVLSLGVGVALSPIPIIGVVLMLGTPRARSNGPAFIVGWLVGVLGVGAIVLAVSSGADASDGGAPADWASVLKLVLGALLLLVAFKQWRARPRAGVEPEKPKWMRSIDSFTAPRSAALAVALSAVNPKNLLLVVGAAAAIAQTGSSTGDQIVALIVFAAIATVGVGTPVVLYFALGERSKRLLDDLEQWMSANNAAIMTVICLVIAAKLVGDGISGLSG